MLVDGYILYAAQPGNDCLLWQCVCEQCEEVLPCSVCEVDSASAPQFDWTSGPRMVTSELPRFVSAAFSGATWLNWTEERQPLKPFAAACITFSLKFSFPTEIRLIGENACCYWWRHDGFGELQSFLSNRVRRDKRTATGENKRTTEGWRGSFSAIFWTSREDLLVTLPNVRDLIKISSASDDSVYLVWMSWSIWLSGEKSDNKPITRNLNQGNSNTRSSSSSSTFQYIIDWELCSLQLHTKPYPPTAGFEVMSTFHFCPTALTQLHHLTWWSAIKHCRIWRTSTDVSAVPTVVHV